MSVHIRQIDGGYAVELKDDGVQDIKVDETPDDDREVDLLCDVCDTVRVLDHMGDDVACARYILKSIGEAMGSMESHISTDLVEAYGDAASRVNDVLVRLDKWLELAYKFMLLGAGR